MIKPKILDGEMFSGAQWSYIKRYKEMFGVDLHFPLEGWLRQDCHGKAQNDYCYKEMLEQFKEWGFSACPHDPSNLQARKAYCPECWQILLEEG